MTLHERTGSLSLDRLGPHDLVEVFGFLDQDPVLNVYLLALTLRDGLASARDEFWGVRRDDTLIALLHLGSQSGAALPVGVDPPALRLLADQLVQRRGFLPRRFQVIGPRAAARELVRRLERESVKPRIHRDQVYMKLEPAWLAPFERLPGLRRAGREDYTMVFDSGARLRAEELEEDPRVADPGGYARRTEDECRDGYTHLWCDADGLRFRASVSAVTPDAAQVSGVYTPPERRNQGFARRGLSELCTRLFERSRIACLFVNDFNAPALAVYRRMGFRDVADWASAFYPGPG
jgi:ribosomal protein S18 acetylase RimI-like enzyme